MANQTQNLVAHYRAVRQRLNAGLVPDLGLNLTKPPARVAVDYRVPFGPPHPFRFKEHITPDRALLRAVCVHYGLTEGELIGHRKFGRLMRPRAIASFLFIHLFGRSSVQAGWALNRDHSTVLHWSHTVGARLRAGDAALRTDLVTITEMLGGTSGILKKYL